MNFHFSFLSHHLLSLFVFFSFFIPQTLSQPPFPPFLNHNHTEMNMKMYRDNNDEIYTEIVYAVELSKPEKKLM